MVLVIGLSENPITVGLVLSLLVYIGIRLSGAHYNPAVTIAMIFRKLISVKQAFHYIIVQILGAVLAAFLVYKIKGTFMSVAPAPTASISQIVLLEFVLTLVLIMVILFLATDKRTKGNVYYGAAIGGTVMLISLIGGGVSGGAFNPAVGFGPILFESILVVSAATINNFWYYIVGPISGAIIATYIYTLVAD